MDIKLFQNEILGMYTYPRIQENTTSKMTKIIKLNLYVIVYTLQCLQLDILNVANSNTNPGSMLLKEHGGHMTSLDIRFYQCCNFFKEKSLTF